MKKNKLKYINYETSVVGTIWVKKMQNRYKKNTPTKTHLTMLSSEYKSCTGFGMLTVQHNIVWHVHVIQ